jgi:hypothetical protein
LRTLDLRGNRVADIDLQTMTSQMPRTLEFLSLAHVCDVAESPSRHLVFCQLTMLTFLDIHGVGQYTASGVELLTSLRTLAFNVCAFCGCTQTQKCAVKLDCLTSLKRLTRLHVHARADSPSSIPGVVKSIETSSYVLAKLTSLRVIKLTCDAWTDDDAAAARAAMAEAMVGRIDSLVKLQQVHCGPYGPPQELRAQLGECEPRWRPLLRSLAHVVRNCDQESAVQVAVPDVADTEAGMLAPGIHRMLAGSGYVEKSDIDASGVACSPPPGSRDTPAEMRHWNIWPGCQCICKASGQIVTLCLQQTWFCGALSLTASPVFGHKASNSTTSGMETADEI